MALDVETGELLGTHSLRANRKTKKVNGSCLAVSPKAKRRGVATQMLRYEEERIRKAGYKCICENTAVDAEWSVNWHLRNGFRIIGFFHSEGNNYNSYAFRKQLAPSLFWDNSLFCRCRYLISYLVTRFL